jgi:hypothetical protein
LRHSGWKFFVRIPLGEKALLFDNPLSENSLALAERASLVVVVGEGPGNDSLSVKEWGERYCLRKELLERIQLCIASGPEEMPFKEKSFSVIIIGSLDNVLETYRNGCSRWMASERLVADIFKYLRPGGQLFISMKKSSAKSVLNGERIGLLPLWIVWRLRKQNVRVETIIDYYPSLGNVMIVQDNVNNQNRARNVGIRMKAFLKSEAVGIVCKKSYERESRTLVKEIINDMKDRKEFLDPGLYKVIRGSGGTFVLNTGQSIIRIPRLWYPDIVRQRWLRNFNTLKALRRLKLPFKIPEPIHLGDVEGQPYSIESKIPGYSSEGIALSAKESKRLGIQTIEALTSLFTKTAKTTLLDEKEFRRLFGDPIGRCVLYCNEDGKRKLEIIEEKFRSIFLNTEFPLIRTHGDFKRPNFIFGKDDRLYGICDWDLSLPSGLPLLDLYLFLGSERVYKSNQGFHAAIFAEFVNKSPLENQFVGQYLDFTYPINERKATSLAILTVIYYFAYHSLGLVIEPKARSSVQSFLDESALVMNSSS